MGNSNTSLLERTNGGEIQGWLKQKSKYLRAWRDQYIVFNSRTLKILQSKTVITDATRHSAQVIDIAHYDCAIADGTTSFSLSHKSQPSLSFKAPTMQCRDEWVTHINTALGNHQRTPSPRISCLALPQTLEHIDVRADSQKLKEEYRDNSDNEEPQETKELKLSLSDSDDDDDADEKTNLNDVAPNACDAAPSLNIASLSDDEEEDATEMATLLTQQQLTQLELDGFCALHHDDTDNPLLVLLVRGWARQNHCGNVSDLSAEVMNALVYYHGPNFYPSTHVCLFSGGDEPARFLTTRLNLSLSVVFGVQCGDTLDCTQTSESSLRNVLQYLGHHRGVEPDPLPCPVRSIHMAQIVSDPWDATWIDGFEKKEVFEVILASNYMGIKSLMHLGCAKISTLIKQMDQREINRVIEDEEARRRRRAAEE